MTIQSEPTAEFSFLLDNYAATGRFRFGLPARIEHTPHGLLFLRSEARDGARSLYLWPSPSAPERLLVSAQLFNANAPAQLSPEEKARQERQRLLGGGITDYRLAPDGRSAVFTWGTALLRLSLPNGEITTLLDAGQPLLDMNFSPTGEYLAYVSQGAVWVLHLADGECRQLTPTACDGLHYGAAEFVAQEEMGRASGYWWAPHGSALLVQSTDERDVETLWISDPLDPVRPPQPWRYPRAGRANAKVALAIYSLAGGPPIAVQWDASRYPYLAHAAWGGHEHALLLSVQTRDQREGAILRVDISNGECSTIHQEQDTAWLNLVPSLPSYIPEAPSWWWATERSGAWELERRDLEGTLIDTIPVGSGFRRIVAANSQRVWLIGGTDASQEHVILWEKGEDSEKTWCKVVLTASEPGLHSASQAGPFMVHEYWPEKGEPNFRIRRRLSSGWTEPEATLATRSEAPQIMSPPLWSIETSAELHAALILPPQLPVSSKCPVLLHVYGGPHAQMVRRSQRQYALAQWWAARGWAVVFVDGRGTPGRGREFERAIHLDFATVPLSDHIDVLHSLANKHPALDLERVAIFGWSFGGYLAALAALERPDIIRAAVAGAPVTDWAEYDTHYTERYLGHPTADDGPQVYHHNGLISRAASLRVPLLLAHGTADDNVYFHHTLRFTEAAFKAGTSHWLQVLPLPGETHAVQSPESTRALYQAAAAFLEGALRDAPK